MIRPSVSRTEVAAVSVDQMRELDRVAIDSGLSLLQMMENAGIRLSEVVQSEFGLLPGHRVVALAGGGNNGGGALTAARHLVNRGIEVIVVLDRPREEMGEAGRVQLGILDQAAVSVSSDPPSTADAVIDGLVGYGLRGNPQGRTADLVRWVDESRIPTCSLDVPTGLNGDSGLPGTPCVRASVTLTLALPKKGLLSPRARAITGTLLLADISIPEGAHASLGLTRPVGFRLSPVIEIST